MKLIVGLGNRGEKYIKNRHNVGFMFLDYLVNSLSDSLFPDTDSHIVWHFDKYIYSELTKLETRNQKLILAKPQTYMNKSGEAVKKLVNTYLATNDTSSSLSVNQQLTTNNQQPKTNNKLLIAHNLIVVHDDLDIPFGKFRIVNGYGPKLHNGIESIQNHLQTMDFLRIRIGVDNRDTENRIPGIDYVLQNFSQKEFSLLPSVFSQILNRLKTEKYI